MHGGCSGATGRGDAAEISIESNAGRSAALFWRVHAQLFRFAASTFASWRLFTAAGLFTMEWSQVV